MQITKLQQAHTDIIFELFKEQFIDDLWSKKDIIESFNNKVISFYGIFDKDKLVCVCSILETLDDINLLKIATKHEYKKMGFAKNLLQFLISLKKQNQTFSLEVKSQNVPAIKLYESLGFKTLHIRKRYYKNGDDALCMFLQ